MFCPNCGAEYREGFTRCADCDVGLTATPPEPHGAARVHERLIILRTFPSEFEAQIALAALRDAGIDAMVRSDNEASLNPGLTLTRGVELLVRESDAAEALDVLQAGGRQG